MDLRGATVSALIEGRVAQILSDKHVIVNAGSKGGVTVGMSFVVLAQGEEVKDPASGETLGRWELPKGYLRVTHVQERMCTCEGCTPIADATPEGPGQVLSAAMIEASMRSESWGGAGTRLDVNRSQVSGLPRIPPISIGDPVREVRLSAATH
jgi:hypothetical protein